jgi:hypothetical protein
VYHPRRRTVKHAGAFLLSIDARSAPLIPLRGRTQSLKKIRPG